MAEYLIQSETLTQLADTMRSVSDGVPNPCTLEQMNECIPNLSKKLSLGNPDISISNGRYHIKPTIDIGNISGYEIYRTYGYPGHKPSVEDTPVGRVKLDKNGVAKYSGATTFKIKAYSEKGYQSSEISDEEFVGYMHSETYYGDGFGLTVKVNLRIDWDVEIGTLSVSPGESKSINLYSGDTCYGSLSAYAGDLNQQTMSYGECGFHVLLNYTAARYVIETSKSADDIVLTVSRPVTLD